MAATSSSGRRCCGPVPPSLRRSTVRTCGASAARGPSRPSITQSCAPSTRARCFAGTAGGGTWSWTGRTRVPTGTAPPSTARPPQPSSPPIPARRALPPSTVSAHQCHAEPGRSAPPSCRRPHSWRRAAAATPHRMPHRPRTPGGARLVFHVQTPRVASSRFGAQSPGSHHPSAPGRTECRRMHGPRRREGRGACARGGRGPSGMTERPSGH